MPPARIAECAAELQALLGEHGFLTGVAGHASAGNLHFMLTPDFAKAEDLERYESFMAKLVELILGKYDGSLKAEHGTGVNMAPYVEREWGEKATALMWRVKELADPDGVLAPGVLLNRDPGVHLRNLKTTPEIEEEATACVECGFCEPVCPSRDLTTTPRQRIVLRREMARQPEGSTVLAALREQYEYDGLETCAADGSCLLSCPVGIDTGKLVKELRSRQKSERAERAALGVAKRWERVERAARGGLALGHAVEGAVGEAPVRGITPRRPGRARPRARPRVGRGDARRRRRPELPPTSRDGAAAVYFPACINRIFGPPGRRRRRRPPAAAAGARRRLGAGRAAALDPRRRRRPLLRDAVDLEGAFAAAPSTSPTRIVASAWRWTGEGRLPLVVDASSCTHGIRSLGDDLLSEREPRAAPALEILDSVAWAQRLLPRLEIKRRVDSAVVHPTCSVRHLGLAAALDRDRRRARRRGHRPGQRRLLRLRRRSRLPAPGADRLGDRAAEAREVRGRHAAAHLASNRTCEVGLERATGERFESFVYLLDELTR